MSTSYILRHPGGPGGDVTRVEDRASGQFIGYVTRLGSKSWQAALHGIGNLPIVATRGAAVRALMRAKKTVGSSS